LGGWTVPGQRLGMGVRMHESMPDGFAGVTELPGDLMDGHAIAPRPPNRAVVIHGNHVLGLRVGDRSVQERSPYRRRLGWVPLTRSFCPQVGPAYALTSKPKRPIERGAPQVFRETLMDIFLL